MVAQLGRFSSNSFVKTAEAMIIPQQEMMAKAISDTVTKVVDDMKTLAAGGGAATQALIEQQKAQRKLNMQISTGVTGLLSETEGLITKVTELTKLTTSGIAAITPGSVETSFRGGQNDGRAVPINGPRVAAAPAVSNAQASNTDDAYAIGAGGEFATPPSQTTAVNPNMLGAMGAPGQPTTTSDPGVQDILTKMLKQSQDTNNYMRNLANAGM
jgi:hypothetical protein